MATWLHDVDTLRYLADEEGGVGDWASLQLHARGAALALPRGPEARVLAAWFTPSTNLPGVSAQVVRMVRHVGLAPAEPGAWTDGLVAALSTPTGPDAADLLVLLGGLAPAHLQVLIRHEQAPTLPLWLATAADDPGDVAASLEPWLRADLDHGAVKLQACCELALPLPPASLPRDPVEALLAGRRAAGADVPELPRGSVRKRLGAAIEAVALGGPIGALIRAAAGLRKAPALSAPIAWSVGYGSVGPVDLPSGRALDAEPGDVPEVVALRALAFPDAVTEFLASESTRRLGRAMARWVQSEEVLTALLSTSVPGDPDEALDVAYALASMGTPAVAPTLRALLPYLDDRAVVVRERYEGLLQQAL